MYSKSNGFTIIEILVTFAIFIFVMFKSLPLATQWQETLALNKAKNQFQMALSTAKSQSLINANAKSLDEASTIICLEDNLLEVRGATASAEAGCTEDHPLIWQNKVNFGTKIYAIIGQETETLTCMCFRPSGLSRVGGSNCNQCKRTSWFKLINGASDETIRLT